MKLTSKMLKQMITEEINEGLFDFFRSEPEPQPEPAYPHSDKTSFNVGEIRVLATVVEEPPYPYGKLKIAVNNEEKEMPMIPNQMIVRYFENALRGEKQQAIEYIRETINDLFATKIDEESFKIHHGNIKFERIEGR